ncbi:MAG: hypothetical protein JNJ83_23215 [Verrucomicrobiaceae bacterium]|nr:hypothetical protein [Verrucomicrobiaceae bacterium]
MTNLVEINHAVSGHPRCADVQTRMVPPAKKAGMVLVVTTAAPNQVIVKCIADRKADIPKESVDVESLRAGLKGTVDIAAQMEAHPTQSVDVGSLRVDLKRTVDTVDLAAVRQMQSVDGESLTANPKPIVGVADLMTARW